MELITARTKVRRVAKAWRAQYPAWGYYANDFEKQSIAQKLEALDLETATPEVVNALIGNKSWTQVPDCDECGKSADVVVRVGEQPDYESRMAHICLSCIEKARALFTQSASSTPT